MKETKKMIDGPTMDDTFDAEHEYQERRDNENVETKGNLLQLLNS